MPLFRVQSQSLRAREIPSEGEEGRQFKNEAISEGVGVAFRGVFPLLKSNSCSVEQAVSYFRRSFIYGQLNVFWNNTNLSTEAHVPFSSPESVVSLATGRLQIKPTGSGDENTHVPTPRYGQYLTHAYNHITRLVAAMDSCFALIGAHQGYGFAHV